MKPSYFSKKVFICSLCGEERSANYNEEAVRIICWVCVHKLIYASREQIKALYERLKDRGYLVETFMEEDENEARRNMDGRKFGKAIRFQSKQSRQARPITNHNKANFRRA